MHLFYNWPPSN
jgi:hypothetical protein